MSPGTAAESNNVGALNMKFMADPSRQRRADRIFPRRRRIAFRLSFPYDIGVACLCREGGLKTVGSI
jgi:hypothetical protein